MSRQGPTVLLIVAILGLVLGLAYLVWLVASQVGVLSDLTYAGIGDPSVFPSLKRRNLATPLAIYTTVVSFFLELVLTFILIWTSLGLLNLRRSARWAAVFYGIFMIVVGVSNVVIAFVLASPNVPDLLAVVARGAIVLFAIFLWAIMFLPSVTAAYADGGVVSGADVDEFEEEEEPKPAPPRRRARARQEEEEG
jgi:hypothetical protein